MSKKLIYLANLRLPTEKAYGIQIAKMCEAFASQGLEVELIYPKRKDTIGKNVLDFYSVSGFKERKVWAIDFYLRGRWDKAAYFFKSFVSGIVLISIALKKSADIIYLRDEFLAYILSLFKKNMYIEVHKFHPRRSFLYKKFIKNKLKLIAISQGLKDEFIRIGFEEKNILMAPDGVDIERFQVSLSVDEARRKLDLPQNKKIVMYTGHLFGWKGVDILAEASRLVHGALFVFVGGMDKDIELFKRKFGLYDHVMVAGRKSYDEIPFYLKAADVLIIPNKSGKKISEHYTSPLKLFEYMASGKPIVASALPSIKEILDSSCAILVVPDSPQFLAEGIEFALNNTEHSSMISRNALQKVNQYSWEKRSRIILDFIS